MSLKIWSAVPVGLIISLATSSAWAQFGGPPTADVIAAGQSYIAPHIGAEYANRLASQPDFQGSWSHMGGTFDPQHLYEPYKSPAGYIDFGPIPGSYLTNIPFKPEYHIRYMAAVADTSNGKNSDTFAACRPYGMPRFMGGAGGFDIMQGPELIVMQNNYDNETRRIFMDGRPHPNPVGAEDSDTRTYTGHSIGHWEGDTLVVDTVNMLDGVYDDTLPYHSEQLHLTEHIKLIGADLLEVKMVVEDPVTLTGPWNVAQYYRRSKVSGVEIQPAGTVLLPGEQGYNFHNLQDRPCQKTVNMDNGYQSAILPQDMEKQKHESQPGK